jgi:hypothetical protein
LQRLFGNPDPSGYIGHADKTAGEEEAEHSEDADDGYIPAIGLRQGHANAGNLAPRMRPDERLTGHGLSNGNDRAAVRAEPRAARQPGSASIAKYSHVLSPLHETAATLKYTETGRKRFHCQEVVAFVSP